MENKKYYSSKFALTLMIALFLGIVLMFSACSLFGNKDSKDNTSQPSQATVAEQKITSAKNELKGANSVIIVDGNGRVITEHTDIYILYFYDMLKQTDLFLKTCIDIDKIVKIGSEKFDSLGEGYDNITEMKYFMHTSKNALTIKYELQYDGGSYDYRVLELKYSSKNELTNVVYKTVSASGPNEADVGMCFYEEYFVNENKFMMHDRYDGDSIEIRNSVFVAINGTPDVVVE